MKLLSESKNNLRVYGLSLPLLPLQQAVCVTLVGVMGCFLALVYSFVIETGLHFVWTTLPEKIKTLQWFPLAHYIWIAPMFGMSCWYFVAKFCLPERKGNMNSWIAGVLSDGVLEPSTFGLPIFILSCTNVIAGSSIGPEGPLIMMGGSVGTMVGRWFAIGDLKCLSFCGGAAALSVFFGFPVVSAIFVLEFPHPGSFQYHEYLPWTVWASVVSTFLSHRLTGRTLKCDPLKTGVTCLSYNLSLGDSSCSILWSLGYGLISAGLAIAIIWFVKTMKAGLEKIEKFDAAKACVGGLAIGLLAIVCPQTLFWGEFQLQVALHSSAVGASVPVPWISEHVVGTSLVPVTRTTFDYLQLAFAKTLSISICLGVGMHGGILFPVMFVAAAVSRAFFPLDDLAVMCIMGATLACICRTPLGSLLLLILSMHLQSQPARFSTFRSDPITYLAISIFFATWCTSWYELFQTRNRKDHETSSNHLNSW